MMGGIQRAAAFGLNIRQYERRDFWKCARFPVNLMKSK
jgi:hypothetical protein